MLVLGRVYKCIKDQMKRTLPRWWRASESESVSESVSERRETRAKSESVSESVSGSEIRTF